MIVSISSNSNREAPSFEIAISIRVYIRGMDMTLVPDLCAMSRKQLVQDFFKLFISRHICDPLLSTHQKARFMTQTAAVSNIPP